MPRLLDLFCGAGGAAAGYVRAGFEVYGVDIKPQPHYLDSGASGFLRADALAYLEVLMEEPHAFDVIHASPPCQAYSDLRNRTGREYPDLVAPTRIMLHAVGLPWVIENVEGAPLVNPVRLCGSSFGLGVRRHRLFEMSSPPVLTPPCVHHDQPEPLDVSGTGSRRLGPRPDGGGGNSRKPRSLDEARTAMGIDWMTRRELSQAIPPAYTEWIGRHLLQVVGQVAA